MRSRYKACMVLAMLCFLCIAPQKAFADTSKSKGWEYDWNENKTVEITEKNSYAKAGQYTWLKYKPAADGYLTVKASGPEEASAKGYLALYDGTKTKLLSSSTIFYNTAFTDKSFWYEFTFGLQKEKEYYIRVRAENAVQLRRTFKKVNDVSGSTRAKARALKKNKTRTGLIAAGTSGADWYQLNLTKKQKLRLYYSAMTSGSFKLSVYYGKELVGVRTINYTSGQKLTLYLKNTSNMKKTGMNAGKYYIKIERANTASSGVYKIRWN